MTEKSKIIDDTIPDDSARRKLQNRIIGIVILYIAAILLYVTAGSQEGLFPYLLIGVLLLNTWYLIIALFKLSMLGKS